jgi:hypothetical protein
MAFFRTILIFIIIFYLARMFTQYILPALFGSYTDDQMEELKKKKKQQQKYKQQAKQREGEVTIDYSPQKSVKGRDSKGEYVDYVEVKD